MRRFLTILFIFAFMLGGTPMSAYATDCEKDTLIDKFGDWFGNLGKKEKNKKRNIAVRKANRLAACAEKQAKKAANEIEKTSSPVKGQA